MTVTYDTRHQARIALLRQAVAVRPKSADLILKLADALADRGEYDEFAQLFQRAYRLAPSSRTTLGNWSPETGTEKARKLRDKSQALIDRGVIYSPVVAALAICEAILGNKSEVKRLVDYDRFFAVSRSIIPSRFVETGCDFYKSLTDEIKANVRFYDAPRSKAIRKAWRHDDFMNSNLPACRELAKEIRRRVDQYIARLPVEAAHPFIASTPSEYVIGGWAVISDGASYHLSHVHPKAWMSGVYYVVRPDISRLPETDAGWLRVGPPSQFGVSPTDGWQERTVEPEPGNLVLMPGYFFHSTRAMGVDQERICIAFDVVPLELAGATIGSDEDDEY